MKTDQIVTDNEYRRQRLKDYFFDATFTLKKWNYANPNEEKLMTKYAKLKSTLELSEYLKGSEQIEKPIQISTKGTWMHPYMFIDFAMWLSIEFKVNALKWVADGLIKSRNDAGDYHKEMCSMIMTKYIDIYSTKPPAMLFINESRMIKEIANLDIDRNEMTEKDLSRITILQKVNSNLISKNVGKASRIKQLTTINESLM
jgi:hypothetical protein